MGNNGYNHGADNTPGPRGIHQRVNLSGGYKCEGLRVGILGTRIYRIVEGQAVIDEERTYAKRTEIAERNGYEYTEVNGRPVLRKNTES